MKPSDRVGTVEEVVTPTGYNERARDFANAMAAVSHASEIKVHGGLAKDGDGFSEPTVLVEIMTQHVFSEKETPRLVASMRESVNPDCGTCPRCTAMATVAGTMEEAIRLLKAKTN
jgi:hypothetical protein